MYSILESLILYQKDTILFMKKKIMILIILAAISVGNVILLISGKPDIIIIFALVTILSTVKFWFRGDIHE